MERERKRKREREREILYDIPSLCEIFHKGQINQMESLYLHLLNLSQTKTEDELQELH